MKSALAVYARLKRSTGVWIRLSVLIGTGKRDIAMDVYTTLLVDQTTFDNSLA